MKGAGVPRQKITIASSNRKRRSAATFSRSRHRVFGGPMRDESTFLRSRVTSRGLRVAGEEGSPPASTRLALPKSETRD